LLPRIAYLDFAGRWFGQVRFDLASSGLRPVTEAELGPPVAADDLGARQRFQSAVARRYSVPESEVVPCLGGSGAVFALMATVLSRGERVLCERPGYEPLLRVPEGLGFELDRFERRREEDFAIDPDRVLAALQPSTAMVAVTNPHNPSGVVTSDAVLAELARRLAEKNVFLFVDEAYLELAKPRATARKLGDNVLACASATKCWGVPWARAGFALVPEHLAPEVAHVERYVAGMAPPAAWAWGERAFERADWLLERADRIQEGKREVVDAFVRRSAGALEWVPPHDRSLFGFVRDRRGVCNLKLIERGVAEHGVLVSPGEFFETPGSFRLSWTAEASVVAEGLERLAALLDLVTLRAP
jgi:aspartate/methionine/tyrosine aminotransferase